MSPLLPAVCELANRLGADAKRVHPSIRLTQTGRMRDVGARGWMSFRAEETISNWNCAFDWRARLGPLGPVAVRDALTAAGGSLEVKALGLFPIRAVEPSAQLTRGELMRYLAELAMAPDAILLNPELRWRSVDAQTLIVSAGLGETATDVRLSLDREGRIASTYASDRPRAVGETFVPTPWQGRFSDYRLHEGRWLPFRGQVAWFVDGAEAVYWEGQMLQWESLP